MRLPMTRFSPLVLLATLALFTPATALAQLVPPAGSAGAGNSAISGVPFGPANPRVLSDPSGIGNASSMPPLTPNRPAPPAEERKSILDLFNPPQCENGVFYTRVDAKTWRKRDRVARAQEFVAASFQEQV